MTVASQLVAKTSLLRSFEMPSTEKKVSLSPSVTITPISELEKIDFSKAPNFNPEDEIRLRAYIEGQLYRLRHPVKEEDYYPQERRSNHGVSDPVDVTEDFSEFAVPQTREANRKELIRIYEEARKKIDAGEFGLCSKIEGEGKDQVQLGCEEPINPRRLIARGLAVELCVKCQTSFEKDPKYSKNRLGKTGGAPRSSL